MRYFKPITIGILTAIGVGLVSETISIYLSFRDTKAMVIKHDREIVEISEVKKVVCALAIDVMKDKDKIKGYCIPKEDL